MHLSFISNCRKRRNNENDESDNNFDTLNYLEIEIDRISKRVNSSIFSKE